MVPPSGSAVCFISGEFMDTQTHESTGRARDDVAIPTRDEMLARARAMQPRLRERAAYCEELGRLPDETLQDFFDAGLIDISKPKHYGGYELGYDVMCEVIMEISKACGSSGWVLAVFAEHNVTFANNPKHMLDIVWGDDPKSLIATGGDPNGKFTDVEGGHLFTGRTRYSSGCDHVQWWMTGGANPDTGERKRFLIRREQGEIDQDSWNVMGLAGTGSKFIDFKEAFIPHERVLVGHGGFDSNRAEAEVSSHPNFRIPPLTTAPYTLASVSVGISEGFIDDFTTMMKERESRFGAKIAEFQSLQLRLAESAAEQHAARRIVVNNLRESLEILKDQRELPMDVLVRNRRDMSYAPRLARDAADRLFYATGANGLFLSNDLQRKFRDIHAAGQQFALNWDINGTAYGRHALGLEVKRSLF